MEHSLFIKSLEMTTDDIKKYRELFPMDDTYFNQLINILSRADQIKYAKEGTTQNQRAEDIKWIKDFLKKQKQPIHDTS